MRIIAGDAKGRRIIAPSGRETRPTSDRVKESLFNILGSKVLESKVLDLFAGTGNIGLEAISRGAEYCIFIDNSRESIKIINENIRALKYSDYCEVYNNKALFALDILDKRNIKFDIIFLDPPYHKDIIQDTLKKIIEIDILKQDGIIVAEHDTKDVIPDNIKDLVMSKSSIYGNTVLSFFKKIGE